ncbi:hypothetical protein KCU73_g5401, partial [Aureobasidium melanogenum]
MSSSAKDSRSSKAVAFNTMSASASSQGSSAVYTPPILKLPVELLRMIFSHCNKDDDFQDARPNVRLACKYFEPLVAQMLAKEWSGCLNLRINKSSMDALGGICPIFASHLKILRLCTQHLHETRQLDHGKSQLGRKRRKELCKKLGWSRGVFNEEMSWLKDRIDVHNQEAEDQQTFLVTGGPLAGLSQALRRLKTCHNHSVTLGVYDPELRYSSYTATSDEQFEDRMAIFGTITEHATYDVSGTLQILRYGMALSGYQPKAMSFRIVDRTDIALDKGIFDKELSAIPILSLDTFIMDYQLLPDFERVFSKLRIEECQLTMTCQCFAPGYDFRPYPEFSRTNYRALYDHIRHKGFKKLCLRQFDACYDFLESGLNLESESVESLEIYDMNFAEHLEEHKWPGSPLTFLSYLKTFSKLKFLMLEQILYQGWRWIQKEPVEWNGQTEIQEGLDLLIEKTKSWYF